MIENSTIDYLGEFRFEEPASAVTIAKSLDLYKCGVFSRTEDIIGTRGKILVIVRIAEGSWPNKIKGIVVHTMGGDDLDIHRRKQLFTKLTARLNGTATFTKKPQ
ncbi:MAG: hypothetical protein ACFFD4_12615 [Candidatus Odinarchaeota archaeon]